MTDELPKTYKAVIYDEPGKVSTKVVDLDMPEPGPGEVLIKMSHSGICHSDLGVMTNRWASLPLPTQPGQVGGHEGVGRVVRLGPGVDTGSGSGGTPKTTAAAVGATVRVGDRVGVKWLASVCFSCAACLGGQDGVCLHQRISGYYTPGTFQQYVVGPANYVTPIPESLDGAAAAPMLCAGVTVYAALRRSGAAPGDWVVLLGAGGGLGHLGCQIAARGMGLRVIGVDAGTKRDLVLECGAEHFIDHTSASGGDDVTAEVKRLTGGLGAKAVLVLTAANAAYAAAMDLLSFGGTIVAVGLPEGKPVPIGNATPQKLIAKAARIVGIAVGNRKEAVETLQMAERGVIKTELRVVKMDEMTKVFEEMDRGELKGRVVVDLEA
ncbi:GroES-like protein [Xylariaceae sp. FL0804]|nr:GroES-like protein [Xylariaceae sp. FL0804]